MVSLSTTAVDQNKMITSTPLEKKNRKNSKIEDISSAQLKNLSVVSNNNNNQARNKNIVLLDDGEAESDPLLKEIKKIKSEFTDLNRKIKNQYKLMVGLEHDKIVRKGGKTTVAQPVPKFVSWMNGFDARLTTNISARIAVTHPVLEKIDHLKIELESRSDGTKAKLNNYHQEWNALCLISDETVFRSDLVKGFSQILPLINSLKSKVESSWNRIHEHKTNKFNNLLTEEEKEALPEEITRMVAEFEELNSEAVQVEEQLKSCLETSKHVEEGPEQLAKYAKGVSESDENHKKLTDVVHKVNGQMTELKTVILVRQWKFICEKLSDMAIQISQLEGGGGLFAAKSLYSYGLISASVEGKQLKVSVAYNAALFG